MLGEIARKLNKVLRDVQSEPAFVLADENVEQNQRALKWLVKSKRGDYYPVNKTRAIENFNRENEKLDLEVLIKEATELVYANVHNQPGTKEPTKQNISDLETMQVSEESYVRKQLNRFAQYFAEFCTSWFNYQNELNRTANNVRVFIPKLRREKLLDLKQAYDTKIARLQTEMDLCAENVYSYSKLNETEANAVIRAKNEVQVRRLGKKVESSSGAISALITEKNKEIVKVNKRFDALQQYFNHSKVICFISSNYKDSIKTDYPTLYAIFKQAKQNLLSVHSEVLKALSLYKTQNLQANAELDRNLGIESDANSFTSELKTFENIAYSIQNHIQLFKFIKPDQSDFSYQDIYFLINNMNKEIADKQRERKELELKLLS